jgi:hypothetical protein
MNHGSHAGVASRNADALVSEDAGVRDRRESSVGARRTGMRRVRRQTVEADLDAVLMGQPTFR